MQHDEGRKKEKVRCCSDEHSAMLISREGNRRNDSEQSGEIGGYHHPEKTAGEPYLKGPGNYGEYYPVSDQGRQMEAGSPGGGSHRADRSGGGEGVSRSQYRPGGYHHQQQPDLNQAAGGGGQQNPYQYRQPGAAGQQNPYQYKQPGTAGQQNPYQYRQPGTAGQQNPYQYNQPGAAGQQNPYQYNQPGAGVSQQAPGQYSQAGASAQGQNQGAQQTVVKNPKTNIVPKIKGPEMNDRDYLNDILSTEKYLTNSFNTFLHEASHLALYSDIKQILNETQDCARNIFNLMFKDSFYSLKAAGKQELQQEQQKFSNYINCQDPYKKR